MTDDLADLQRETEAALAAAADLRAWDAVRVATLGRNGRLTALLPLTVPEVRRLLWGLVWRRVVPEAALLGWSQWRRRHQAAAQRWHYQRRTRAG